ncbi:cortical protein marker for cell polarity-domain-containing protein [Aspergillus coremiiformis]|uniref:Cortical protein marker for cell polarity-domain-containing protein n=1 Tax=Aspergillus coremiiformis TaxID=138285 RepID=A0A5N6ZFK5_9EURO|nr:cortical protein marker for cell polarity-domain-containing protein [Aspergillus coremiiformis]
MRTPSLFRPATAGVSTVLCLGSLLQLSPASGLSFTPVAQPDLDLNPLGQVAFTGDFDAVSLYSYKEQFETTSANNGSQSILTPLPNGVLTTLSTSDAYIRAMCPFTQKDGTYAGIFVAGNFTSLGGLETQGAALFNPDTKKVTALPGLSGSASAVLCDKETNSVYVGGEFKYENSSNAVAWVGNEGWKSLVFGGFNGPVTSILKTDNGHIVFGGLFDGIGNSTASKKNQQIVNLQTATITSDAASPRSGYSDPRNIICQTGGDDGEGKTWLLEDNSPGFWRADMRFGYNPTKIRLYNTHFEGRGTKTFLVRRLPDNGIMNLTYTDSGTAENIYCDRDCPLSNSTNEKYREFHFVNSVGMKGLQVEIRTWYGNGAGLNGIQLLQDDIFAYAINDFNEPSCASLQYPSKAVQSGSWTTAESGQGQSDYLTAKVTDSTASDTSVVFEPDVKQPGNYSVVVYTPGCSQDGTCGSRGVVNVTATLKSNSESAAPIQKTIHQTNLNDKYDTLYTGYVDSSDGSFRPSVTLTPVAGQGDVTIVASRVRFALIRASEGLDGELNGLYDFDPTATTTNSNFTASAVNRAGLQLDENATVRSLAIHDGVMYAGGNFSSSRIKNILTLKGEGNATAMQQGGLNSEVASMTVLDDLLYVGGNFTDTSDRSNSDLQHVAAYSFGSQTWLSLGGGVNGPVTKVTPLTLNVSAEINETTVGVSGDFNQLLAFDGNSLTNVTGFAVWVPSRKNWLQNLNVTQMAFAGQLSACTKVDNTTIIAGSLSSAGIAAAGAASLLHGALNIKPLFANANFTGETYTGTYDMKSNRNLSIVGGHFTTTGSDGSSVENLALLDGKTGTIKGLGAGVDSNSTFLALAAWKSKLYAGGNVTGRTGDSNLNGFIIYDLENGTIVPKQPPRFSGDTVTVNSIAPRPGSNEIYFGGIFEKAGALPCPGICLYDTTEQQWNRPGATLSGNVLALKWMSNTKLLAIGNLTVGGNSSAIATYTPKTQSWESWAIASDLPGAATAFSPASVDMSTFWLAGVSSNGSSYLANYDGSKFQYAGDIFDHGTAIRNLEVLSLSKDHSDVSLLHDDQILLITGQLVIPNFGNASAAVFNGTDLTPFMLSLNKDGQPGSMAQLFYEKENPYSNEVGKHYSNGIVVLISFCCALGAVFLIVIAGVIFNKIQRRRQGYMPGPQAYGTDRPSSMRRVPPEYLFSTLRAPNPGTPAI